MAKDCPFCHADGAMFRFETTAEERRDLLALADESRAWLLKERALDGFNPTFRVDLGANPL